MIDALFFDIFGTVVDWRGTIAREAPKIIASSADAKDKSASSADANGRSAPAFDGAAFADAWRAEYQPAMERVRTGGRGYVKLDILHSENLDRILPRFGLDHLGADKRRALNRLWHRLDGWPDAASGLARLRKRFLLAPMSNGNISIMVDMARHNGFVWDAVLGAEIARDYKPKLGVYRAGCAAFDLDPARCMMVAAHTLDLVAASEAGLRTAHIARPDEFGPGKGEAGPSTKVDLAARDLNHLAELLGA